MDFAKRDLAKRMSALAGRQSASEARRLALSARAQGLEVRRQLLEARLDESMRPQFPGRRPWWCRPEPAASVAAENRPHPSCEQDNSARASAVVMLRRS